MIIGLTSVEKSTRDLFVWSHRYFLNLQWAWLRHLVRGEGWYEPRTHPWPNEVHPVCIEWVNAWVNAPKLSFRMSESTTKQETKTIGATIESVGDTPE